MEIKKKILIVAIITIFILGALVINLNSSNPIIRTLLISPKSGKVIFNNYNLDDTLILANEYLNEGEGKRAYIAYKYILDKEPDNIKAYIGIADIYARIRNFDESKKYIEKAVERIDEKVESRLKMHTYFMAGLIYEGAFAYEGYDAIEKAIYYYNKALDVKDDNIEQRNKYEAHIYYKLGLIYSGKNILNKAVYYFDKSLTENIDENIYYNLGINYSDLKEYKLAHNYLMKYKESFGEDNSYFLAMGYYYTEIGEVDKAKEFLIKAKERKEDYFNYNFAYGNYYEEIGEINRAKEHYIKAISSGTGAFRLITNQKIINKFNINIEDIKEKNQKEKQEKYSQVIKL